MSEAEHLPHLTWYIPGVLMIGTGGPKYGMWTQCVTSKNASECDNLASATY